MRAIIVSISCSRGAAATAIAVFTCLGECPTVAPLAMAPDLTLKDAWAGDHLDFRANLLGQSTTGSVDVADDHVRLEVQLPWVLAMVANKAKTLLRRQGQLMLEKPTPKR